MSERIARDASPGSTSSAFRREFLGPAQPEEEIGTPDADVDQLALEVVGEILEIRGAGIQMEAQPCQWSLRDADVDVARGGGSLRGSHGAIIAGR